MAAYSVGEAREAFAELLSRAAFGKERIVITKHGRERVALVPIEDLRTLEQYEEENLLMKTKEVLTHVKETEFISLEEFKEKHNL